MNVNIPPAEKTTLVVKFTPTLFEKTLLSSILMAAGMYCLGSGKRNMEPRRMVWGAILILAGCCVFL